MGKKNDTPKREEKQEVIQIMKECREKLCKALEEAEVFQRKRKLTDYSILLEALYMYMEAQMSFRTLSLYMQCKTNLRLCATAWKKQIYKAIPVLYQAAQAEIEKRWADNPKEQQSYALDGTAFSAHGHAAALTRAHTIVSLDDGLCRQMKVTDGKSGESVCYFPLEENALYLADRYYGKARQLAYVMDQKAHALFRFSPSHIRLYHDREGQRVVNVEKLLKNRETLSYSCFIKQRKSLYPIRIVGMMLPPENHADAQKKCVIKRVRRRSNQSPAPSYMPNGCCC